MKAKKGGLPDLLTAGDVGLKTVPVAELVNEL